MIKIQMAPSNQGGDIVQAEYIWIIGQEGGWPIPEDEEKRVSRVEVFGPELDYLSGIPGCEVRDSDGNSSKLLRCWYRKEAIFVSGEMRKKLGPPAA